MDCEKYESTLIDELYGELDEATSAEAKRHASGCSRCAGLLAGLRATRKVAVLPMVEPPADLEERILSAAREAQKVVPMRTRVSRFVSLAGSWAMRPQAAMAAVFLLAIGSSLVLMKSKQATAPASVSVKAEGAPVAAATATNAPERDEDLSAAAGAHGTEEKTRALPMTVAPATDMPMASAGGDLDTLGTRALAKDDDSKAVAGLLASKPAATTATGGKAGPDTSNGYADGVITNAAAPAGAPAPPLAEAQKQSGMAGGGGGSGGIDFNTAMNAYRARRLDEATREFDLLGASDPNAALWAARSVREGQGCSAAVARFDALSTSAFGTTVGYEATLDAGRCYRQLGNSAAARARFGKLAGVPAYASQAQDELDAMSATKKAAPSPVQRSAPADKAANSY